MPDVPFELARWSRPKVAPDAHVKVGRTFYSVPVRLMGHRLDARETSEMVRLYLNGELVKTHAFQARGRKTDWADLPAERAPVLHAHAGVVLGPGSARRPGH